MRRVTPIRLTLLSLMIIANLVSCTVNTRSLHGSLYDPPRPAPELNLKTTAGESFKLSTYNGAILLVYFGYTYCPDVCPTTLADVKLVFEDLDNHSEDLYLAMVTVDPERDTPDVLENYLARFHINFIGLRGEGEKLKAIMASYGVFAQKEPSDDPDRYLVSHTARLFLIDQQGMLRTNYPFGTPREDILADLKLLLNDGGGQ